MKILYLTSIFVLVAAPSFYSQTPSQSPPPVDDKGDIVRISTTLIQIDVTATDKDGKIVADLKPEDFEVYENDEKQEITNFSFVKAETEEVEIAPVEKKERTDPKQIPPPLAIKPQEVKRTIALVVDDLTLSFESTYYVQRALRKFVDEQMQSGDLVAIIRTGGGIGALQQFTNDKRQLLAAIEKVRWNPSYGGGVGAFAPIESPAIPASDQTDSPGDSADEQATSDPQAELNQFRETLFATGTLGALNYIIRGMRELPGRKSVMLLSDGFSLFETEASGIRSTNRVFDGLRRLVDLANRAGVVVYTMDARGLQTLGLTAADSVGGLTVDQLQQQLSARRDRFFDTQEGLDVLARETGGIAFRNNNDLGGGIKRMLADQKGYYLIGYTPDSETFDPAKRRFNKLTVKVRRPGIRVRYRSGFFGLTDEALKPAKQTPSQQIYSALTSPFGENGINLRLNALFGNEVKIGSFVRSFLHVNAKDLTFTKEADGKYKAVFEVVAASFGDNGILSDELSKTFTITANEAVYKRFVERGFVYHFMFPVKKPGGYQYRVAIRDHGNSKVGSANQFVEVPNLKKNRLVLSGIVLETMSRNQWVRFSDGDNSSRAADNDAMADTALRRFKRGIVLRYGALVFNARTRAQGTQIETQIRIFRDGENFLNGKSNPVSIDGKTDRTRIPVGGAISLGDNMQPGDYVFQLMVTDKLAKKKNNLATQYVTFEIVE